MAMNQVQFQAGLSIAQFIQQYGTEAKCYPTLYRARWPKGFRCPKCDSNVVLGNVKRAISGCYHAMRQAKYARRYQAEATYRFNRRFRLPEMLPRLVKAMVLCKP